MSTIKVNSIEPISGGNLEIKSNLVVDGEVMIASPTPTPTVTPNYCGCYYYDIIISQEDIDNAINNITQPNLNNKVLISYVPCSSKGQVFLQNQYTMSGTYSNDICVDVNYLNQVYVSYYNDDTPTDNMINSQAVNTNICCLTSSTVTQTPTPTPTATPNLPCDCFSFNVNVREDDLMFATGNTDPSLNNIVTIYYVDCCNNQTSYSFSAASLYTEVICVKSKYIPSIGIGYYQNDVLILSGGSSFANTLNCCNCNFPTPTPTPTPTTGCLTYTIQNYSFLDTQVYYTNCNGVTATTLSKAQTFSGNSLVICSLTYPTWDPVSCLAPICIDVTIGGLCPTPTPTKTPTPTPTPSANLGYIIRECCSQEIIGYFTKPHVLLNQITTGVYYFSGITNTNTSIETYGCYTIELGNNVGLTPYLITSSNFSLMLDCQTCLNMVENRTDCSECPSGYTWSPYTGNTCVSVDYTGVTSPSGTQFPIIGYYGDYILHGGYPCPFTETPNLYGSIIYDEGYDINGNGTYQTLTDSGNGLWSYTINGFESPVTRCSVWLSETNPPTFVDTTYSGWSNYSEFISHWVGMVDNIYSTGQTFYVGIIGRQFGFRLNGETILQTDITEITSWDLADPWDISFTIGIVEWERQKTFRVYPVYFPPGNNTIEILSSSLYRHQGKPYIGCEIYDNTYDEIISATTFSELNLVYSTINRALLINDYPLSAASSVNCFDTVYPIYFTLDYECRPNTNVTFRYWPIDANRYSWVTLYEIYSMTYGLVQNSGTTPEMLFMNPIFVFYDWYLVTGYTINPPYTGYTNFDVTHGFSCPPGYYYDRYQNLCVSILYCEGTVSLPCPTPTPTPSGVVTTPTPTPTNTATPTHTPTPSGCNGCRQWYYNNSNPFDFSIYFNDCGGSPQSMILMPYSTGYTSCSSTVPTHKPLPQGSTLNLQPLGNCCGTTPTPTPTPTSTPNCNCKYFDVFIDSSDINIDSSGNTNPYFNNMVMLDYVPCGSSGLTSITFSAAGLYSNYICISTIDQTTHNGYPNSGVTYYNTDYWWLSIRNNNVGYTTSTGPFSGLTSSVSVNSYILNSNRCCSSINPTPTPTLTPICYSGNSCVQYKITNNTATAIKYSYVDCDGYTVTGSSFTPYGVEYICGDGTVTPSIISNDPYLYAYPQPWLTFTIQGCCPGPTPTTTPTTTPTPTPTFIR